MSPKDADRFWAGVVKTDDCWYWTRCTNSGGYGTTFVGGRPAYVHRVAYEDLVGPIPEGLTIDHLCRVRNCVNPAHLEPVTALENMRRGWSFANSNALKTHCPQGHRYSAKNTGTWDGRRYCKTCKRVRAREFYQTKIIEGAA